jgi:hypothetical protein
MVYERVRLQTQGITMTKAQLYDVGSYAAHLSLSKWGVGWDQLSLETRKAVLTYHVTEHLRGKVWSEEMSRQDPKDWNPEEIYKVVASFRDDCLDFESVRKRAVEKRPQKGSSEECTLELLSLV